MIFEDVYVLKDDLKQATDAELAVFLHFVRDELKHRAGGAERAVQVRYARCAQIDKIEPVVGGFFVQGLDHAGKHVGVWKPTAEEAIGAFLDVTEARLTAPADGGAAG